MSVLVVSLAALIAQQNPAIIPVPVNNDWWINRHRAIASAAQKGEAKLIFIGDSITHAFGGEPDTGDTFHNRGEDTWNFFFGADKALNLGISGDRTQHVIWRLDNGELGKCKPKVAVVMIGTNNTGSENGEQISEGVEAVCDRVSHLSPATKILLLGIFPRDHADSPSRKTILQANSLLATWAPSHHIIFLDLGNVFVDSNGEISTEVMPDLLHPFAFGYRKWAMAMEPSLAKLMGRKPKTVLDSTNSAVVPVTQSRDHASYDWQARFKATLEYVSANKCGLAIIGDSIMHHMGGPPLDRGLTSPDPVWQKYFGSYHAVDLGCGWDRTENVLWRLEQGELRNLPLRAATVMIGTNNLEYNTPEQIRDGVQAIVNLIRVQKPRAKILLLGIFPRGHEPNDPLRLKAALVNSLIAPIGKQRYVDYMDIGPKFLEPDGTISAETMSDFLHPTQKGYEIFGDSISSWLKQNLN